MTEVEWEAEVYRLADAYCAATTDEDRACIAREFYDSIIMPSGAGLVGPAAASELEASS